MRSREIHRFAAQTRKGLREVEALRRRARSPGLDHNERALLEVQIDTLERATKEWSEVTIELTR